MAITDNRAISFSNDFIRPDCDHNMQGYYRDKALVNRWNSQGLSSIIPNDAGETLHDDAYGTDGTDGDGRPVITGADITNVVTRAQERITDLEAGSNAKLNTLEKPSVNPTEG